MKDPYLVLGLSRSASDQEIRTAWRSLAKECHPDLNPDDQQAEERFKDITAAYGLLSDPALRQQFDLSTGPARSGSAGGRSRPHSFQDPYFSDDFFDDFDPDRFACANGEPSPRPSAFGESFPGGGFAGNGFPGSRPAGSHGNAQGDDLQDLFQEIFQASPRQQATPPRQNRQSLRGEDVRYVLRLGFEEAALGGHKKLPLNSGRDVMVPIPPASEHGMVVRLAGLGRAGSLGGTPGDALVELLVDPHPRFSRQGLDILASLPVTLPEAVQGGRLTLQGLSGPVSILLPAGVSSGQQVKVKGLGIAAGGTRGDLLLTVQIILPATLDRQLTSFIADWGLRHPYSAGER